MYCYTVIKIQIINNVYHGDYKYVITYFEQNKKYTIHNAEPFIIVKKTYNN